MTTLDQTPSSTERTYRPKALLYFVLSVLWVFPSLGALFIFGPAVGFWSEANSWSAALNGTRLEQWLALIVLLAHPVFVYLALRFRRTEMPRPVPPEDEIEEA